ncbi:MAG: C25 family cysteine peptidase [Bacteroidota bacterium]
MKQLFFFLGLLACSHSLWGQGFEYGNNWYRQSADQTFIKLIVDETGIHRVSLQDLSDAGYDLSGVDARMLRVIYRGREIPIYLTSNGSTLEFLEFWGEKNNGQIDSIMYRNPSTGFHAPDLAPNKDVSLFSDESAYFLTWSNVPSGNRYFSVLDPTYSLFTPEPRFLYEAKISYQPGESGTLYINGGGGSFDPLYTLNTDYIPGEGYVGPRFFPGTPQTAKIPTPAPANIGTPVTIKARVFGRSSTSHILRVDLNGNDDAPIFDTTINQTYIATYEKELVAAPTLTGITDLTFNALRQPTDNNHICWASVTYDRLPDMAGDSMLVMKDWNRTDKAYFRLENVTGTDTIFVYDRKNRIRHLGLIKEENGEKYAEVILLGFPGTRDLEVATDAAIKKPRIEAASLNRLFQTNLGAEFVIIAHRGLANSAEAYANYRDTMSARPLSARVVYTDEIYDEFSYGTITSWGIKRFCKYALDNWNVKPTYFLLWGKGRIRTRGLEDQTIVPTYGYPASDHEFIGHFDQNSFKTEPEAAIGRVNLYSDEEGLAYLQKVNEYEHTRWAPWMKGGVFLGGGGTLTEQTSIESAMNFMIDIFEDRPFGGLAYYFQKRESSVIIDPSVASYHDQIDAGTHLIHFFGHSTSNIQDITIRSADQYQNYGRYPLMVAMGCYGGDFTGSESFGEQWVKIPGRGAIGYLANSSAGYLGPLRDYGRIVYQQIYTNGLGQPIGKVLQEHYHAFEDSLLGIQYRNHSRQINLQGDPAVVLYNPDKPDLEVQRTSVFFSPENFTAQDDSFRINIITANQGLATTDTFDLSVRQSYPGGNSFQHPIQRYPMVKNVDTLSFILQNPAGNLITGRNVFEVKVDAADTITEYREDNNLINVDRLVPGNIPAVLYPTEYAVVGESSLSLQASAFFMTRDASVSFIFEIDTVPDFSSSLKTNSGVVTGNATFVEWQVPFNLQEDQVYYWRVRLADVRPVSWATSSFKYMNGKSGWAQARLQQFDKAELDDLQIDELQKEWNFQPFGVEYEFSTQEGGGFSYSRNGALVVNVGLNGFSGNGVIYVILDQYTLDPIVSLEDLGPVGVASVPNELYKLRDAILSAKPGDYIIVGSHKNPQVPTWSEDIFDALEQIGASENVQLLPDDKPFLIVGRKGYPNSATEIFTPNDGDRLVTTPLFFSSDNTGKVLSTRIGPALEWNQMIWDWNSKDVSVQESGRVSVLGVKANGLDTVLIENLAEGTYDISGIQASDFPYLRLEASLEDTTFRTAPQMDNWHVFFTPAPDAVVDPLTNFTFQKDTVFEGEKVFIHLASRNISAEDMDSVSVRFTLERSDRSRMVLDSVRIAPMEANGPAVEFDYEFNTLDKNLAEDVNLLVEVNPSQNPIERHLFNNLYIQPFHVVVDDVNPIMDVTFDGKHIIDGDLVSPTPEILIEVTRRIPCPKSPNSGSR